MISLVVYGAFKKKIKYIIIIFFSMTTSTPRQGVKDEEPDQNVEELPEKVTGIFETVLMF